MFNYSDLLYDGASCSTFTYSHDSIADRIETIDAQKTLNYIIGVEIVADQLRLHSIGLIMDQTARTQTAFP
jgi:hypothetical protein